MAEPSPAARSPQTPTPWFWLIVVAVMAGASAWVVHGVFRALSLAASAVSVFALIRRLRAPDATPDQSPSDPE